MDKKINYCDTGENVEATGYNEAYGLSTHWLSRLVLQLWKLDVVYVGKNFHFSGPS